MKNRSTIKRVQLFMMIASLFSDLKAEGTPYNKNKVYSSHGVGTGSPIYTPQHKKLKGWQRNSKGKKVY